MTTWRQVVLRGALAILVFDGLAATASRVLEFPYTNAGLGSLLIYLLVGYFAAQATGSIGRAALASGIVGAVDATVGWWLSWWILGAEVFPALPAYPGPVLSIWITVLTVIFSASVCGAIGGWIGKRRLASARPAQ